MKLRKRIATLVLICLTVCALLVPSHAAGKVDLNKKCTLGILFKDDTRAIVGEELSLYKIASITENGSFIVDDRYSEFNDQLLNVLKKGVGVRPLATTLEGVVAKYQIQPDYTAFTNERGRASFNNIPVGSYLIIGKVHIDGNLYTYPSSFILNLPEKDFDGVYQYDVESDVKYETHKYDKINAVELKFVKAWSDSSTNTHSDVKIDIEVYADSTLFKTITLSKENNWKDELTGLSNSAKWSVYEKNSVEGYYSEVEFSDNSFEVTNSVIPEKDTDDTTNGGSSKDNNGGSGKLPQTGLLWWPVPVLGFAGVSLIIVGTSIRIKRRRNEK